MKRLTDEELISTYINTQQNEHFALLYERYYQKIYAHCLRFANAGSQAEDLTQDVFERVLHKLDTFRGSARFSTWLFSVCRNYCLTQQQREQQRNGAITLFEQSGESVVFPDTACATDQQLTLLEFALQDLSDDEHKLHNARNRNIKKKNQLATSVQASPSAVKMRLWRARERLRRAML